MLFFIDFVGSLPEFFYVFDTNAYPLKYWNPENGGSVNTILYVELLESQVMLNCVAHCYMSYVMFAFIARRRSVSRLKRDVPPKKILAGGAVAVVLYGIFWALMWKFAVAHDYYRYDVLNSLLPVLPRSLPPSICPFFLSLPPPEILPVFFTRGP